MILITAQVLSALLDSAVPKAIARIGELTPYERARLAREAVRRAETLSWTLGSLVFAVDLLEYTEAIAEALACQAYMAHGIKFLGKIWCVERKENQEE